MGVPGCPCYGCAWLPPRRITNNLERDYYPAWHPNGQQLVIVSEREGKCDLWLVDTGE
ncbi:MAG: hypothetical protein AB7I37_17515 [Pirellulales bacterium]